MRGMPSARKALLRPVYQPSQKGSVRARSVVHVRYDDPVGKTGGGGPLDDDRAEGCTVDGGSVEAERVCRRAGTESWAESADLYVCVEMLRARERD